MRNAGKFWPVGHFRELCHRLVERGAMPVVLYGPGEELLARECVRGLEEKALVPPLLSLRELIALISCCDALVSNDSGPRHMAIGLGVPTVAIFGPTWPVSVVPPGGRHRALQERLGCGPCDKTDCPDPRCLRETGPGEVLGEILMLNVLKNDERRQEGKKKD